MSKYIDLDNVEFLKVDGNEEFNHGVDVCINTLLKQERVTAIPIDKVKQARDEIQKIVDMCDNDSLSDLNRKNGKYRRISLLHSGLRLALEKIDKLIAESEVDND